MNQVENTDTRAFVRRNLRWNFTVNLLDVALISAGLSLVSRETVMPVLVSQLTDSKLAVGLIPALFMVGSNLPQLLSANVAERLRFKKPFVLLVSGVGERLPYALIALVLFLFASSRPTLALAGFFALLLTAAVSQGVATPPWFDMIAKILPVKRRGVWSGLGHGLGALLGVVAAFFVGGILATFVFPVNFSILFGLAFGLTILSFLSLALTREPPSPVVRLRVPLVRYLAKLPAILRDHVNYRRFLVSRGVIVLGTMAGGFYMVFGAERFAGDGPSVAALTGLFTGVLVGSQAGANLVWGLLGDRSGHKAVLAGAAFVMALGALAAYLATSQAWLVVTFVGLGAYLAADQVSALNVILEFCGPSERPTFIGLTNTLMAPVLALSPLLGGLLVTFFGFGTLFLCALAAAAIGGLLMTFWVREPRHEAAK